MAKFYDVIFHEAGGKSVIKRQVVSEKDAFDAWEDACVSFNEKECLIQVNEELYIRLNRAFVAQIEIKEVEGPIDKQTRRQDEVRNIVNALSNMGF